MPAIKIERYWPDDIKKNVKQLSKSLERKDFSAAKEYLSYILSILKDKKRDGKSRVSVCFIIDQLKGIDPFIDPMVDALMETLQDEKDAHVKEFSVWALGQIVQENLNMDLIRQTMPIFVKFCNDASIHVKKFAEDIKERLDTYIEEKKNLDEKIKKMLAELRVLIEERINEMINRAKELSKEALQLDYRAAFERRAEMEEKIRKFKQLNAEAEDEILAYRDKLAESIPAIKGESRELIQHWRDIRGEKEALIRRVHCILRIQGKIYKIIVHIQNRSDGQIDINKLKEETEYSDQEIIEILKKLVDEEIIPNFMLDSIEGELKIRINNNNEKKPKS
ncbi:MAG: hypothetical protein ACTSRZ_13280 [Promethearchaeota archaeon]